MKKVYYLIALFLAFGWLIGFFVLGAGAVIHSMMMVSMISCLQGVICNPPSSCPGKLMTTNS